MIKKLVIQLIIYIILSTILIAENKKLPFLKKEAFDKMTNNEKYFLINELIKEYNNIIDYYYSNKIDLQNEIDKKNNEIEKLKKQIKLNQIGFLFGYGLNTKLENNILFNIYYNHFFYHFFGVGFGVGYIYNTNKIHTIFFNGSFSILF